MIIVNGKIYTKVALNMLKAINLGSDVENSTKEWIDSQIKRISTFDEQFARYLTTLNAMNPVQTIAAISVYMLFEEQCKEDELNAIAQSN